MGKSTIASRQQKQKQYVGINETGNEGDEDKLPKLFSFNETADILKISRRGLAYLVARGEIKRLKIGSVNKFEEREIMRFIKSLRVA